jgi:Fe-S cluster assembly protein SufD
MAASLEAGDLAGAALLRGPSVSRVTLDPALVKAGVIVSDLRQAAREHPELVRSLLGSIVPAGAGKFEALNAALWRGGLIVHVPRGVEVGRPIHLWRTPVGGFEAARVIISTGERAEATVIDESAGGAPGRSLVNTVVEVVAGPASRLRHVTVQRLARTVVLHHSARGRVDRDAKLLSVVASLGGSVAKADLGALIEGTGGEVELVGFLFGEGRQHFDHHTVHDHRRGHSHSDLDFKVVLKDRARSAYTGLIRIAPEAPQSEAYQENRNLLLSDGSKADSIPELEILTDEVMCTHGATMGSLDPEHVFYLVSRGIPRPEARRMIVGGFIEPTLTRLPEDMRERLRRTVDAALASL